MRDSPLKRPAFKSITMRIISRAVRFGALSSRSHTHPPTFDGVLVRSGFT
jgi:hypothetical protein